MDIKDQLFQLFEVSDAQADLILSKFRQETFEKNTLLATEGKLCGRLSFIEDGIFRVFKLTESREVTQWMGGKGYFVTDLSSFFFGNPANYSIEALTPATVWTLDKQAYLEVQQEIPDWNILEKRFIAKCFMVLESRVFDFIARSAEERYIRYFEQHKSLFNQVPLQYIASVLGMSPETLSRIRNKLAN
ncbi:Crp/Fnr family transcriptional regulator [Sphingobacterium lactis]|uniref:cAMP-binding domain of CRP or a regulatory subunit of cAMP-dependent protein kinases n=1 Tax=Sphingobacterium lactis TaxID=797291 RepID=A0A1H5RZX7_9SPHI|nr:Crp/Fnr family transcriptional regulator [Sphingobacterium lactis]SEF43906.1 cAMP-binding domain of CRP or a regulatory subunit of cAMP-dependent protein kinases [Sphingobacterium lactis]